MISGEKWVSSGLAFLGRRELDFTAVGENVCTSFKTLGQPVIGKHRLSDGSIRISTRHFETHLQLLDTQQLDALDQTVRVFLSLRLKPRKQDHVQAAPGLEAALLTLLRALQAELNADFVQWTGSDLLFPRDDFAMATAALESSLDDRGSEARALSPTDHGGEGFEVRNQAAWASAPAGQDAVRDAMRACLGDIDPDEDPEPIPESQEEAPLIRLSAWLLSLAVALLYLPLGLTLITFNLLRGENLRMASQAAALTGTFISLQTHGSMAQAGSLLHGMLH